MNLLHNSLIGVTMLLLFSTSMSAQNYINVYGNSSNNYLQTNIQKADSGYMVFGTTDQLGIQHFDWATGNDWKMYFYHKPDQITTSIAGTGGVIDNDSTYVVLGRVGKENTAVIKATKSGRIVWSFWYSTGLDEHPDKIIKLKNGDFLISTRTNVDYYEFGEWGSHAAVFRISNEGKLLWSRLLDYRSANTSSYVLGMYETLDNSLLITQAYNANLGLFKLKANGDSIKSLISNQSFVAVASDYNANTGSLYVTSSDKKILCFDSSFNLKWHKVIAASLLSSINLIRIISDTALCFGGKYNGEACFLYADTQAIIKKCYYKRFFTSPSTVAGFFKINQEFASLSYPGYAVSQHNYYLNNSCFNTVNGSLFTTSNNSFLTFKSHVKINGTATWDEWKGIITIKTRNANPTVNCKSFDISIQPEKTTYSKACRNVPIKVYITNHGTTNITKISYRIYAEGKQYDSTISISALGSKSASFFIIKTIYIKTGTTTVTGKILKINDMTDEFVLNDSFEMTFNTKVFDELNLSGKDSVCEGESALISSNGKAGTYSWYKNNLFQKQGVENYLNASTDGKYHMVYKDSGCVLHSDTFQLTLMPLPVKPIISENSGILTTNAQNRYYWYYNNQFIDSNKTSINTRGLGNYKVVAFSPWGCKNESNPFYYSVGIKAYHLESLLLNINNSVLQWNGSERARITILTVEGKLIHDVILNPKEQITTLKPNIYLIKIFDSHGNLGIKKIWIRE